MTSNIEYWCTCGAGAVGTEDELPLIEEWITDHGNECDGEPIQDTEQYPYPAACNRCGFESKASGYDERGQEVRQHMAECKEGDD